MTDTAPVRVNLGAQIDKMLADENRVDRYIHLDKLYPSSAGKCRRQLFLSMLDESTYPPNVRSKFLVGTAIHEILEEKLDEYMDDSDIDFEVSGKLEMGDWHFSGRADVIDRRAGVVTDLKTRASWYHFDSDEPPQKHIDQVLVYMKMFGVEKGQLLYLQKKDLEKKYYPAQDEAFLFDEVRFNEIVEKIEEVRAAAKQRIEEREGTETPLITGRGDIPYNRCSDCYPCSNEAKVVKEGQYRFTNLPVEERTDVE